VERGGGSSFALGRKRKVGEDSAASEMTNIMSSGALNSTPTR